MNIDTYHPRTLSYESLLSVLNESNYHVAKITTTMNSYLTGPD